jgi:hypothetical protein
VVDAAGTAVDTDSISARMDERHGGDMRTVGNVLMGLGLAVGACLGLTLVIGHWLPWLQTLPWLVAVGLGKLTFVGALGLLASGAVLRRLGDPARHQRALEPPIASRPRNDR